MRDGFDFDHTSIGVEDLDAWARFVRRELGGIVIMGQEVGDFRYLLFHVGTPPGGGRLELISPRGDDGFMHRFVRKHGETFHHVTFTVPDVEATVAELEELGLRIASRQFVHDPWREAFVMPDGVHGVVIQIADSTLDFPSVTELAATTDRDVTAYPHNLGGSTHDFWSHLWQIEPAHQATVLRSRLGSTEPALSRVVFGEVLHGEHHREGDRDLFSWGGAILEVTPSGDPGLSAMTVAGLGRSEVLVGTAQLRLP